MLQEVLIMARLRHPNCCLFMGYAQTKAQIAIVTGEGSVAPSRNRV